MLVTGALIGNPADMRKGIIMNHFYTDSYPMQIKRVSCDAEVGTYKTGWHVCNKKAIWHCIGAAEVPLDYCAKHEQNARARKDISRVQ